MSQTEDGGAGRLPGHDRVIAVATAIARHEAGALQRHFAAASERVRVARRARSLGELLRDQIDLLPESRARLRRDRLRRRELWRQLVSGPRRAPRAV